MNSYSPVDRHKLAAFEVVDRPYASSVSMELAADCGDCGGSGGSGGDSGAFVDMPADCGGGSGGPPPPPVDFSEYKQQTS